MGTISANILIIAKNQASGVFKQLSGDIKTATSSMGGIGDINKKIQGTISSFLTLGGTMATVGIAANALKKAMEFSQQVAAIERLKTAGSDLAASMGSNYDQMIERIKEASLYTVGTSDAMLAANKAMMLGLGADAEKLANLMEVAALRGRAMGLTTTQAFSDIVTGIGRMSPLILDNLGIVIDSEKRYSDYAVSIGKTADMLSSAEKRQILLNSVLEEGNVQLAKVGGLVQDQAGAWEALETAQKGYWTEVKIAMFGGVQGVDDLAASIRGLTAQNVELRLTGDYLAAIGESATPGNLAATLEAIHASIAASNMADYRSEVEYAATQMGTLQEVQEQVAASTNSVNEELMATEEGFAAYTAGARTAAQAGMDFALANRNIGGSIQGFIKDIEFLQAGGGEIVSTFDRVKDYTERGVITPEQGAAFGKELYKASLGVQYQTGEITGWDVARGLQGIGEQVTSVKDAVAEVTSIDVTAINQQLGELASGTGESAQQMSTAGNQFEESAGQISAAEQTLQETPPVTAPTAEQVEQAEPTALTSVVENADQVTTSMADITASLDVLNASVTTAGSALVGMLGEANAKAMTFSSILRVISTTTMGIASAAPVAQARLVTAFEAASTSAENARASVEALGKAVAGLSSKTIFIYINYVITTSYSGTGTGGEGGGTGNDAGGGGGGTTTYSCFPAGTMVTMADGEKKPIEQVHDGDEVTSFRVDEENRCIVKEANKVVQTISRQSVSLLRLAFFGNKSILCTPEHPFLVTASFDRQRVHGYFCQAGLLKPGDDVMTESGVMTLATMRLVQVQAVKVYNLVVENNHTYIAGGFYVHNQKMQMGGVFSVPPGYPSDNYILPLAVRSGEKVSVAPPGSKGGISGGGNIYAPMYVRQIITGNVDSAMASVDLRKARKERFVSFMGGS